jgi:hypothetical protein
VCALEWCWAAGTTYPVLDFFANVIKNECRPVRTVVALQAGNVHGLCAKLFAGKAPSQGKAIGKAPYKAFRWKPPYMHMVGVCNFISFLANLAEIFGSVNSSSR